MVRVKLSDYLDTMPSCRAVYCVNATSRAVETRNFTISMQIHGHITLKTEAIDDRFYNPMIKRTVQEIYESHEIGNLAEI